MIHDHRHVQSACAGFSAVEMLVALLILCAVAGFTIHRPPSDQAILDIAAADIRSVLRTARTTAILKERETTVSLDAETHILTSSETAQRRLESQITIAMVVAGPERDSAHYGRFRFYPDGSSTGGSIRLSVGNKSVQVCVAWLNGRITSDATCSDARTVSEVPR